MQTSEKLSAKNISYILRTGKQNGGLLLIDWLAGYGINIQCPMQNIEPDALGNGRSYCRWCLTCVGYPLTELMIKTFESPWTCTSCTPVPSPSIIVVILMGKISDKMRIEAIDECDIFNCIENNGLNWNIVESILHIIEKHCIWKAKS